MASPRSLASVFALAAGFALAALPVAAKTLAKIDGVEITEEDAKVAAEDLAPVLPPQLQQPGPARDAYILDYLIDAKLVGREAEKEKFGEGEEFARKLAYQRQKIMMEALLAKLGKDAVTDAAMRKVYDDAAKAQKPEEEAHARHILVPTEDEAKAVVKRLEAGEDFVKVATEVSKDPGSPGGDLGWFTRDKMVKEFADAAFALEKGKLSAPVKSQFGWHVIRLEDKRTKAFPPYETVKDQIERYVQQKAQAELIMKLRAAAKIERAEPPKDEAPKAGEAKPAEPKKP